MIKYALSVCIGLFIGALATISLGSSTAFDSRPCVSLDTLTARVVRVQDEGGNTVASLGATDTGGVLFLGGEAPAASLYGADGYSARLSASRSGGALTLGDSADSFRVLLADSPLLTPSPVLQFGPHAESGAAALDLRASDGNALRRALR